MLGLKRWPKFLVSEPWWCLLMGIEKKILPNGLEIGLLPKQKKCSVVVNTEVDDSYSTLDHYPWSPKRWAGVGWVCIYARLMIKQKHRRNKMTHLLRTDHANRKSATAAASCWLHPIVMVLANVPDIFQFIPTEKKRNMFDLKSHFS